MKCLKCGKEIKRKIHYAMGSLDSLCEECIRDKNKNQSKGGKGWSRNQKPIR
jgi:NMD protein affecting ribosome stability and mRNA decay